MTTRLHAIDLQDDDRGELALLYRFGCPAPSITPQLLRTYFLNRTDRLCTLAPWGKPCPIEISDPDLDAWLCAHVLGGSELLPPARLLKRDSFDEVRRWLRLGAYAPAPDGKTKWMVVDFDGGKHHSAALRDPKAAALDMQTRLAEAGFASHLERSASAQGFHLWVFFSEPVNAESARCLGLRFAPRDAELSAGGKADPDKSLGIEIIPKTTRLAEGGLGNAVWLPWARNAKMGGSIFLRRNAEGDLHTWVPNSFESNDPVQIEAAIGACPAKKSKSVALVKTVPAAVVVAKPPSTLEEWQEAALTALDLADIYGDLLTGKKSSGGWLECCDPESPTGDRTPSAGVADEVEDVMRGTFHSFRDERTLSPFEYLVEIGEAESIAEAYNWLADTVGAPLPVGVVVPGAKSAVGSSRPAITVNGRQLRDIQGDVWDSLLEANKPTPRLFARSGELVRLAARGSAFHLEPVVVEWLYACASRHADFFRTAMGGCVAAKPPKDVLTAMLADPCAELPALEAVISTPVFSSAAELITEPGYHPGERLYLAPPVGWMMPALPSSPTATEVKAALAMILDELLPDFCFVTEADRAHALAAFVLVLVRRLIPGPTPLHALEAPTPGSGKGLLANVISLVATGVPVEATTVADNDEEIRKKLTAALSQARPIILLDNVDYDATKSHLDSRSLASVLTSTVWTDRILGRTQMTSLPNLNLWLLTGNNPRFSMELVRRTIRCRIDPKVERPWLRSEFKHPNLAEWVMANRPQIVHALLVLAQAWVAAGKPAFSGRPLGSFEAWSKVIGGILDVAGVPGFLANLDQVYAEAEGEVTGWDDFLPIWWGRHRSTQQTVEAIWRLSREHHKLIDIRGGGTDRSEQTRIGLALSKIRDRIIGCFKVVLDADKAHKGRLYKLEAVGELDDVDDVEVDGRDPDEGERVSTAYSGPRRAPIPIQGVH
jgi:hypothetical protein